MRTPWELEQRVGEKLEQCPKWPWKMLMMLGATVPEKDGKGDGKRML